MQAGHSEAQFVANALRRSFFINLQGLYSKVPAQAGYGDKWPS